MKYATLGKFLLASLVYFSATNLPAQANCLDDAALFAERICGAIEREGGGNSIKGQIEAGIKANNLLSKIIGSAGVIGSTVINKDDYVGLVREQLGSDRKNTRECRESVFDKVRAQVCKFDSAPVKKVACYADDERFCPGRHDMYYDCGPYYEHHPERGLSQAVCHGPNGNISLVSSRSGGRCGFHLYEVVCLKQ